jgi:hypothetical protein
MMFLFAAVSLYIFRRFHDHFSLHQGSVTIAAFLGIVNLGPPAVDADMWTKPLGHGFNIFRR